MDPIIARHLPLITNRIPFTFNPSSSLPHLTNRNEFRKEFPKGFQDAREQSAMPPSVLPNIASSLKYSDSVVFALQKGKESEMLDKGKAREEDREDEEGEEVTESNTLIPKPSGEPGRPHSGGYSLDEILSPWGVATLAKVTVSLFMFSL